MMFVYRARLTVSYHARGLDLVQVRLALFIMVVLLAFDIIIILGLKLLGLRLLGLRLLGLRVRDSLRLALAGTLGSRLLDLLGGSLWDGALGKSV